MLTNVQQCAIFLGKEENLKKKTSINYIFSTDKMFISQPKILLVYLNDCFTRYMLILTYKSEGKVNIWHTCI